MRSRTPRPLRPCALPALIPLAAAAISLLFSSAAFSDVAEVVLSPSSESHWPLYRRTGPFAGLSTVQGYRSVITFDLASTDLSLVQSASLELLSVNEGNFGIQIEQVYTPTGAALDPFVFTTVGWSDWIRGSYESEAGPQAIFFVSTPFSRKTPQTR